MFSLSLITRPLNTFQNKNLPLVKPTPLSFSYQKRSALLKSRKVSAIIHANVGPTTAFAIGVSETPPAKRSMSSGCLKFKDLFDKGKDKLLLSINIPFIFLEIPGKTQCF